MSLKPNINEGSQDYYTGDLEKRFNYFWEFTPPPGGTINFPGNPWLEFERLIDAWPNTPAIRELFYTASGRHTIMSRGAYYRWVRSLRAKRQSEVT